MVSALGADARSRVFYNRVKGEMQAAVSGLGYDTVVVAQPSLDDLRVNPMGDYTALQDVRRTGATP